MQQFQHIELVSSLVTLYHNGLPTRNHVAKTQNPPKFLWIGDPKN